MKVRRNLKIIKLDEHIDHACRIKGCPSRATHAIEVLAELQHLLSVCELHMYQHRCFDAESKVRAVEDVMKNIGRAQDKWHQRQDRNAHKCTCDVCGEGRAEALKMQLSIGDMLRQYPAYVGNT